MSSQRKKVIVVFIILVIFLSLVFFVFSSETGKNFFLKTVNRKKTEKTLSDRKKCEENFVIDEGKINWANKHDQLSLLRKYAFCEFGTKADYEYCNSGILSLDKGDAKNCQKIIMLKKVFLPLAQKEKSPQDVVDDLKYFQLIALDSQLKGLLSGEKINPGELLNDFVNKDGKVCDGLDKKESCLGFFTGDVKYCQNILFDKDKNSCINEAILRQALESQNIEKCLEINDEDGLFPVICQSILNKDDQYCSDNGRYLNNFIGEYCKTENPLPI